MEKVGHLVNTEVEEGWQNLAELVVPIQSIPLVEVLGKRSPKWLQTIAPLPSAASVPNTAQLQRKESASLCFTGSQN